ncbi:hypothetical protein [Dellaglioa algida]|uniref:hypothetical protein n=1 Tax=Dellaglioa algida TaxID=105612 RepID=UPI0024C4B4A0|nr:hypothetical protein [Dellaglioa algida]MDK1716603.1 hypothetical protein [Dellaglioa algida]MDK1721545.1 hypothetical protein [Dellaglioa algida]
MQLTFNDRQLADEAADRAFMNTTAVVLDFNDRPIYSDEEIFSYGKDYFTKDTAEDYMEYLIENRAKEVLKDLLEYHGGLEILEDLGAEEVKEEQLR